MLRTVGVEMILMHTKLFPTYIDLIKVAESMGIHNGRSDCRHAVFYILFVRRASEISSKRRYVLVVVAINTMSKPTHYALQAATTSDAIYCCKWYNIRPIADRKMFLMLLQSSQIPMCFAPMQWIELSLHTFVEVWILFLYTVKNMCIFIMMCIPSAGGQSRVQLLHIYF